MKREMQKRGRRDGRGKGGYRERGMDVGMDGQRVGWMGGMETEMEGKMV